MFTQGRTRMKFGIIQHAQNGKRHGSHVNQFSVNTGAALFAGNAGIKKKCSIQHATLE
jgi:hypothetical protein